MRPRTDADATAVVAVADRVRAVDRWPPHRVRSTADFVLAGETEAAIVAELDGSPVGHVALQARPAASVASLAEAQLGVSATALAAVARLFVDPKHRGQGVGEALLDAVVGAARALHKHPVLDVWVDLERAIALYERAGWTRLGEVTFTFGRPCGPECLHTGNSIRSHVYSAPPE